MASPRIIAGVLQGSSALLDLSRLQPFRHSQNSIERSLKNFFISFDCFRWRIRTLPNLQGLLSLNRKRNAERGRIRKWGCRDYRRADNLALLRQDRAFARRFVGRFVCHKSPSSGLRWKLKSPPERMFEPQCLSGCRPNREAGPNTVRLDRPILPKRHS